MAIEVRQADHSEIKKWDDQIVNETGSCYHQIEVLKILEEYSSSKLIPLIGYKGQELIGVFPIFEVTKGPASVVFSPPPSLGIPSLGPVLVNTSQLKRRKFEKRNQRFIESCLDWIEEKIGPQYVRIESNPGYSDPRPFDWAGFDIHPKYTYKVDISNGPQSAIEKFSRDARSNIKNTEKDRYTIVQGDESDVRFVVEMIQDRYEAQGKKLSLTKEYVVDLYNALEDNLPVYVGLVDGKRASGVLNPRFGKTTHFWQGGGKPDVDVPINDLIHWEIINDSHNMGHRWYDLTGANTPRICRYKSKYNPELVSQYTIEKGVVGANIAKKIYEHLI